MKANEWLNKVHDFLDFSLDEISYLRDNEALKSWFEEDRELDKEDVEEIMKNVSFSKNEYLEYYGVKLSLTGDHEYERINSSCRYRYEILNPEVLGFTDGKNYYLQQDFYYDSWSGQDYESCSIVTKDLITRPMYEFNEVKL
jgi:hypothetical protein